MGRERVSAFLMVWVLLVSGLPIAAGAQSQVETDRPDVSNSTRTVPPGAFQIEAGLEYVRSSVGATPTERRLAVQSTLRAGLTDRLEVRLEGEPLVRLRGEEEATDHGDFVLGFKYRWLDAPEGRWWPSLGMQPFVKVPIVEAPIGSERPDFGLLALASLELPWQVTLDFNAGLVGVGQSRPNGYLLQALVSGSLGLAVTERLSTFLELFFASRAERDGHDRLGLDAGVIYLVTRRVALDTGIETRLTGQGPDYAIRSGVSVRFGP